MLLLSSAAFFKDNFSKNYFRNTIRVSSSLNPDQERRSVGHDLGTTLRIGHQQMTKVASCTERVNMLNLI